MAKKTSTSEPKAEKSSTKKVAKAPANKASGKAPAKKAVVKKATATAEKSSKSGSSKRAVAKTKVEIEMQGAVRPHSLFSELDIALFQSGKHFRLYNHMGAHEVTAAGVKGTYFAVWAPNARSVAVVGNFNFWNRESHMLFPRWDGSGIWEGLAVNVAMGELYKFSIETQDGRLLEKADPFAHFAELRPRTSSISWKLDYAWNDQDWMLHREQNNSLNAPHSVYEVHLASWRRSPHNPEDYLSYDQIADALVPYAKEMGFTHVEFMPVMEHPFDGSWGYQLTGYFAPSSRFGDPQGFMRLVDRLHQEGIGVILDWVPAHFPGDAHGLYEFDGTHLYEHADPRKGFHPDWKSYIFNLGRNEVRAILISNAMFWLDKYHADGLRVDAVASMLYLDYSRNAGEWIPNELGGRENLENVSFLKELNETVYAAFPGIQTIAEESTSWSGVSRPTYTGGLGFGMKWMMGWMNDSLRYFERDPYYRQYHQNELTFSLVYAFTENFMLPLSHDEVVHGKKSLIYKMPGDDWQRFANLRLLYMWMFTHPGAKLLFQGCEFAQTAEWNHQQSLDWHLLQYAPHQGISDLVKALNGLYKSEPALYERSFEATGFEWIDTSDAANSIVVYMRKGHQSRDRVVVALNLTPVPRHQYRIGVPFGGEWKEVLNSDDAAFYGSGIVNEEKWAEHQPWQNQPYSIEISLPPLGGVVWVQTANEDSGL